ncbi:hypothetical protein [Cumulibacter manganitolerans]|uniref:hypothetical protein n=1 Tax=Cumulibacter manganitolerans TaxID=1884992 RepID=UPI001297D5F3|nr:hypothetical protein [Cumulibacter manganitolerans]
MDTMSARGTGPGRILVMVYAIFALAAGARAGVQIATKLQHAPVAYVLSAVAALIYLLNAIFLGRASASSWRVARALCLVELVGVLAVGTASLVVPQEFPDATVWSRFGIGYGFVPLVLPILGLAWLGRTRPDRG